VNEPIVQQTDHEPGLAFAETGDGGAKRMDLNSSRVHTVITPAHLAIRRSAGLRARREPTVAADGWLWNSEAGSWKPEVRLRTRISDLRTLASTPTSEFRVSLRRLLRLRACRSGDRRSILTEKLPS
jgi:hypothetical protein